MSNNAVNRRKLLGALALTTSTLAMGAPGLNLDSFIQSSAGQKTVESILKKHVGLLSIPEKTLSSFYTSLLKSERRAHKKEFFLEHLDDKVLNERLEAYVIEEFLLTTNYLYMVAGEATELRMINA